jgi:HPP family
MRLRSTSRGWPRLTRDDPAWHERVSVVSALLLLPPFLGIVALAGSATHLRFLLFPPVAAIGYALFLDPDSRRTGPRSAVIGPVVGALIGAVAVDWFPAGPLRVMIVTALALPRSMSCAPS